MKYRISQRKAYFIASHVAVLGERFRGEKGVPSWKLLSF